MTDNQRGALLMMCSMAAFTINDSFIKALGPSLPLGQILFLRGAFVLCVLLVLAWKTKALRWNFARRDWTLIWARGVSEAAAAFFFLEALFHMPLANITAMLQLLPLTVALGSVLLFGEPMGWRRFTAIGIGFLGMLLIVRPDSAGFGLYTLYGVIAVIAVTFRDLVTRRVSKSVPSLMVTLIGAFSVWVMSWAMILTTPMVTMTAQHWGLMMGAVAFVSVAYLLSVMVMRVGDISFVALFRYSGLLWALALGLLVFGEWPTPLTLVGAALIVGSGLYTMLREAQIKRRAKAL